MLRRFLRETGGNLAIAVAVAFVPLMGGLALAVDYAEMSRQREATRNALDAAGIATARHFVSGASSEAVIAYARDFFDANLGPVDPADAQLSVILPSNDAGGGTLRMSATLTYKPYFFPVFQGMAGQQVSSSIDFSAATEIRLKNTLEVALVLDNSGSMSFYGTGSGERRMTLLKSAAKQLVETIALQGQQLKQVEKPVQFGLVPFAASVNVGPEHAAAPWIDGLGLSPVHHENFDWTTLNAADRYAEKAGGVWRKRGGGWGEEENEVLSRFSLYKDMKKVESREWVATGQEYVCTHYWSNGTCRKGSWQETGYYVDTSFGPFASWQGCVEARPYPLNVSDTPPNAGVSEVGVPFGDPATLFVPMFAPDEPGDRWLSDTNTTVDNFSVANNWWNDDSEGTGPVRQRNMTKYWEVRPYGVSSSQGSGPNYSCTTNPVTPLTDVTTEEGLAGIKGAIDAMQANGNTNVPEGIAWGWRLVSSRAPFTEGRPESEKGNDKVVIVLTDGANTYSTAGSDPAGNKSTYAAYGYTGVAHDGGSKTRLFMGTTVGAFNYTNSNYTAALNQQMTSACGNAKADNVIIMTVSLDLSTSDATENAAIEALKACASESRFRKGADGAPQKLYWNATGSTLSDIFKRIADELSNLRIVG